MLEIAAVLKYVRPIPNYMDIDCKLTVRAFVDGACPIEKELHGLEAFRNAVIRLVKEGLTHPPNCEATMEPFVSLKLTGGEGHQKPSLQFNVSVELEHRGNLDYWALHWENEEGQHVCPMFLDAERALSFLKCLLDKKTGEWATLVPFQTDRVDS